MNPGDLTLNKLFSEQMRLRMEDLELTQRQLSEMTGLGLSVINRMYNNRWDKRVSSSTRAWSLVLDTLGIEVGFRFRTENPLTSVE